MSAPWQELVLVGLTWGGAVGLGLLVKRLWPIRHTVLGAILLCFVTAVFVTYVWILVVETLAILGIAEGLAVRRTRSLVSRALVTGAAWVTWWRLGRFVA